jgi:hypothetical protein
MMNDTDNISMQTLRILAKSCPSAKIFYEELFCNSYDDFVKNVYSNLEDCINIIEEDAKVRSNDGEDRLSTEIITFFKGRGYLASRDEMIKGGHTDLVLKKNNYKWLGEAKIHSGYDYLVKGFNQLCTRYSSGTENCAQGALIIYVRVKDAKSVIDNWKAKIQSEALPEYSEEDCEVRGKLSFYTTHKHVSSGLPYKVKHVAVVLHFDPKDK